MPGIKPRIPIKLVQLMLSCKNWTTTSPHNPLMPQSHTRQPLSMCRQNICTSQVSWVQFLTTGSLFTFPYFHLITTLFQCEARILIRIIFNFYVGLPYDGLIVVSRPTLHWALFGSNVVAGYHGYQCLTTTPHSYVLHRWCDECFRLA